MLERNCQAAKWLLCCAAVLTFAGCTTTREGHMRRNALTSQCPDNAMHACVRSGHGRTCGCVRKQSVEAILRSRL
jgi:hypothetical protein